jgi:hypothetical protein
MADGAVPVQTDRSLGARGGEGVHRRSDTMIWVKLILGYCLLVVVSFSWVCRLARSSRIDEE